MKSGDFNGLALAYIGDAYYELKIREFLLSKGFRKVNDLHKMAINYTSGDAQSKFMDYFLDNNLLTEDEIDMYKKGRNSNVSGKRKNLTLANYMKATGFESMIGYLYLENKLDRINYLLEEIYNLSKVV